LAIPQELEAKILRYFHVEKWKVGTIAAQLGVHHGTVDRVLSQAGLPKIERPHRPSLIDPYLPFVLKTLEQYPKLTASRLYAMVRERGYSGGEDHFRHLIAHHRPRPQPEASLRLKTLPAEQGQVDWGHFGKRAIGKAERTLMAFVMVLSFSRAIFLRFFLDARRQPTSCAVMRRPSPPGAGCPGSFCTIISRARCSSARAMRSAATPRGWNLPRTIASSHAR
jgi:hypothetical protein